MSTEAPPKDRTLPHNPEAERTVLGAILVDNQAFNSAAEILHREDFYREAHRRDLRGDGGARRAEPADRPRHPEGRARAPVGARGGGRRRLPGRARRRGAPHHERRALEPHHQGEGGPPEPHPRRQPHRPLLLRGGGRGGGAPRPGREVDLRHRRAADPRRLRRHAGDRQGELPHDRPALAVEGRGHRARHRLRATSTR